MDRPAILSDFPLRPVQLPANGDFTAVGLALGQGSTPLEVLLVRANRPPQHPRVRSLWKQRNNRRAAPLLAVVLHGDGATVCGPLGDDPPVYPDADPAQVERICRVALDLPDRHAVARYLADALEAIRTDARLPGLRNEGFLATHELDRGARLLPAWEPAQQRARPLLGREGPDLLNALGYNAEPCDQMTSILRAGPDGQRLALAVLLRTAESPDGNLDRFAGLSPVSYAMTVAERENLPYVLVAQGRKLRLYPVKTGVGVGQRGRNETYVQIDTGLLRDDDAAYLWLLFSSDALGPDGTLAQLIRESRRFAGELAKGLRDRIYGSVVPTLAEGIATAWGKKKPSADDLADMYEMALTALFRLLFIAYAEDKDLLPYRHNGLYQRRSLKQKADDLLELYRGGTDIFGNASFTDATTRWDEITRIFRSVEEGNREWGVPEYNGGLFSSDPDQSRIGGLLRDITLPDSVMGPVLRDLLLIKPSEQEPWGPVDFRSLGVREFGTIYEGLLESELSVAEADLVTDRVGSQHHVYRPAREGEEPVVRQDHVYLHNRSGQRKATGSYFTKDFAVEHLLDQALEPALAEHTARLDRLDDEQAAKQFFDFRVADIAMGSGHFLVAAVDRVERALTSYLSNRRLPGVYHELQTLRGAAQQQLGSLADQIDIEDNQLLRRQVARRCIYGVDVNQVAVDLARLSIWIHTFVPGLPLSVLDHNLVRGNSLVGIGRVSEIEHKAREENLPLFTLDVQNLVGEAVEPLRRLANLAEADIQDVKRARRALAEARDRCAPAEALCDIVAAARMEELPIPIDLARWDKIKDTLHGSKAHLAAVESLADLDALHFPVAFPEVFARERPGFDVIIGNPPWEKVRVEEHEFWGRHYPGLRGMRSQQRDRTIADLHTQRPDLLKQWNTERDQTEVVRRAVRDMPGMNTGHPDLFRAFIWRFIQLIRPQVGRMGIVLPGDTFKIAGAATLRRSLADTSGGVDVQMLSNKGGWVFDDVHQQKLIALVVARARGPYDATCEFSIHREIHTKASWQARASEACAVMECAQLERYSPTLVVPLLPRDDSWSVVHTFMKSPRMRENASIPVRRVYADFETSKSDKQYWHDDRREGDWPVYKGESFDLWNPDTGSYYKWTNAEQILDAAVRRRQRARADSPYGDTSQRWRSNPATHPILRPRIAFRDVTNRTNTRTLVCALIPPCVVTVQTAPWVLFLDVDHPPQHEAYLLGVMSSRPLDWWTRRFVEGHVDQEAFDCLRVPAWASDSALCNRVVELAGRLACPDARFADWAAAVGVEHGPLAEDVKQDMIHELDAVVAHLYGLNQKQLTHIFETFHEGWDYKTRLKATLEHYRTWAGARQHA